MKVKVGHGMETGKKLGAGAPGKGRIEGGALGADEHILEVQLHILLNVRHVFFTQSDNDTSRLLKWLTSSTCISCCSENEAPRSA